MRAQVLRSFIDGNNGREHRRGRFVNLTEERFNRFKELGYVTDAPEDSQTSPSEKKGKKNVKLENLKNKKDGYIKIKR